MDVLYQQYQISNCNTVLLLVHLPKQHLKHTKAIIRQLYFLINVDNAMQYGIESRANLHNQSYLYFTNGTLLSTMMIGETNAFKLFTMAWLEKIQKYTHLMWIKMLSNCPPWFEKILKYTHLKWLKMHSNCPPSLEKCLKYTCLNGPRGHIFLYPSRGQGGGWQKNILAL